MKIALVRPPVLQPGLNMANIVAPPIGPAYVAAALRQAGHQVSLIDAVGLGIDTYTPYERGTVLHGLSFDELVHRIPADTEAIGVSIQFSYEWPISRQLLKQIREAFPKAFLLAGGEHVTAAPDFSLEDSSLDAIVLGEGEHTVCDVAEVLQSEGRAGLTNVPGIVFRDAAGRIEHTQAAARIKELAKIPWPAWDLLPLEEYLVREYGFGVTRGRSVPILASRGCPYQCTFCSNPAMWTTRWKPREPGDVLDEIAYLQKTYRATNFDFYDLTMIVKKEWIVDFCHAIEARGMTFTWQLPSGTRSEAIDQDVTQLLYRTGCRNLSYAPESGSEETLKIIKKRVSIPRLMQSMHQAVRNHLNVKCNFIFGFPHESWKNILESFRAIVQSAVVGIHDISVWVFVPYPGCELFDDLRASGKISQLNDDFFFNLASYADISKTFSYCEKLSKNELIVARLFGMVLFYGLSWLIRPWRPVGMIYRSIRGKVESRSELALRGYFTRLARGPRRA